MFALTLTIDVGAWLLFLGKGLLWMATGAALLWAFIMWSLSDIRWYSFALACLLPSLALATEPDLQGDLNAHKTVVVDGRIRVKETLVSPCYDGGRIDFSGGTQNCLHFDWEYKQPEGMLGHASALVWAGEPNKGPILEVRGAGLLITGGGNFIGYRQQGGPWKNIDHAKDLCALAILFRGAGSPTGTKYGLDNGSATTGPIFIGGCRRGIQFGAGIDENNADNCHFGYIACSHVDNLICFVNRQAVSYTFDHLRQLADGTEAEQRAFELLRFEAGGKCLVDHVEINQGLVCRAIRSDWNTGFCHIETVSIDPGGGEGYQLFDGAPDPAVSGMATPCPFDFSIGKVWNGSAKREPVSESGWLIDVYAGQRVTIEGGGLLEAANGPSIRLRGSKTERAVVQFRGVEFDTQSTPRELIHPSSEHYTVKWTDCRDRKGLVFSGSKSKD